MTRPAHAATTRPQLVVRTATSGPLEIVAVPIASTQATVQLQGEVDLATAGLVATALTEQLAQGHRFVRLDLSRLTVLDCSGLRVLVLAHNQFLAANGTLVLTGVGARVARLLSITHLDEALLVADGPGEPRRVRHLAGVPTVATP
jgi:anti-sigma B factor antagonist